MSADHLQLRQLLGSYALGAVEPAQRTAVEAHLDGCEACREELAELDAVARKLALASPRRPPRPPLPPGLGQRLFERIAAERRRRNRRTSVLTAAAAASLLVVLAVFAPVEDDPGRPVEFAVAPEGVTASATLRDWGWGTQLYLQVDGLPSDQQLAVWLERPDGTRVSAGTFRTTGGGELHMALGAGLSTSEATAVGVSHVGGETVLLAPLDAGS